MGKGIGYAFVNSLYTLYKREAQAIFKICVGVVVKRNYTGKKREGKPLAGT